MVVQTVTVLTEPILVVEGDPDVWNDCGAINELPYRCFNDLERLA